MANTPLLHIGMPKCASTWMQRHYFNRKHGFHRIYGPLKTNIAFVAPPPFNQTLPENLSLQAAGDLVPVITGESLAGSPLLGGANAEAVLERLTRLVPEAKILIVIREQRSMLRSMYQLLVNWGNPHRIEELIDASTQRIVPRFSPAFLCYDKIISAYQARFQHENVLVLPYENLVADPDSFLLTISEFCGIQTEIHPITAARVQRENRGRSLASLWIKRMHNRFIARTAFNPHGIYAPKQIQATANLDFHLPESLARWQEQRFAARIESLTGNYYAASNLRTEQIAALKLEALGYRLP